MKRYIIMKINSFGRFYYEDLDGKDISWTDNIKRAKVFIGATTARKARTGPGASKWKILDEPK